MKLNFNTSFDLLKKKVNYKVNYVYNKIISYIFNKIEKVCYSILKNGRGYFTIDLREKKYFDPFIKYIHKDYDSYLDTQKAKTSMRLKPLLEGKEEQEKQFWSTKERMKQIAEYSMEYFGEPVINGICHGTRTGAEQKMLQDELPKGSYIFGTEIEPSAEKITNTLIWDFHEIKEDWENKFDLIYSNSHDQAHDPEKAINNWIKSLKKGGLLFLEHSRSHGRLRANHIDPWGVETEILPWVLINWSKKSFYIYDCIQPIDVSLQSHKIFVIRKN